MDPSDFWLWLQFGIEQGFCTDPYCDTHDGTHMTPEEEQAWEEGYDPCIPVIRLLAHPEDV